MESDFVVICSGCDVLYYQNKYRHRGRRVSDDSCTSNSREYCLLKLPWPNGP